MKAFGRPSWGELKNTVRVAYVDRADGFTEKTAQAQDLASIEVQGGEVSLQELTPAGALERRPPPRRPPPGRSPPSPTPWPRSPSRPTARPGRSAPGRCSSSSGRPSGSTGMVCRVVRVGTGRLDNGTIEIEAMEDVFAVDWTAYSPPPATGWVDPAGDVPALTGQAALAAPYEAVKDYGFQGADVQQAVVMAARGAPGLSMGYKVHVDRGDGSWFVPTDVPFFTPSGTLVSAIDERTDDDRGGRGARHGPGGLGERPRLLPGGQRLLARARRPGRVHRVPGRRPGGGNAHPPDPGPGLPRHRAHRVPRRHPGLVHLLREPGPERPRARCRRS